MNGYACVAEVRMVYFSRRGNHELLSVLLLIFVEWRITLDCTRHLGDGGVCDMPGNATGAVSDFGLGAQCNFEKLVSQCS